MTTIYHEIKHPRKVSAIADEKVAGYGSTDGGTIWTPLKIDTDGNFCAVEGLIPVAHDYISSTYDSSRITQAVCRTGGADGSIVATLDFGYTTGKLTSVARS